MATFGNTDAKDGNFIPDGPSVIVFSRFQMGAISGVAQSISVYIIDKTDEDFAMAIYDDDLNLVANTDTYNEWVDDEWVTKSITCNLVADAFYYLAGQMDTDSPTGFGYTNATAIYQNWKLMGIEWPESIDKDDTTADKDLMIYVTYAEPGSQKMILGGNMNWH